MPDELREGSYALGSRKARHDPAPSCSRPRLPGIVSGALLAVARAAGETAPLLFTIGSSYRDQLDLFNGAEHRAVGADLQQRDARRSPAPQERAWGAALTLIGIVFIFTMLARLITAIYSRRSSSTHDTRGVGTQQRRSRNPCTDATTDDSSTPAGGHIAAAADEPRVTVFELSRRSRCTTAAHRAVDDVTLDIAANEITAFIGPSGCGKSTLLRCLNRMNDLIAGRRGAAAQSRYHGEDLYGPKVDAAEVRRRIGMVFQKPNPFPKSIYDNVAFGPRINGASARVSTTSSSRR